MKVFSTLQICKRFFHCVFGLVFNFFIFGGCFGTVINILSSGIVFFVEFVQDENFRRHYSFIFQVILGESEFITSKIQICRTLKKFIFLTKKTIPAGASAQAATSIALPAITLLTAVGCFNGHAFSSCWSRCCYGYYHRKKFSTEFYII